MLVDPDRVEAKNLNRILNSTRADVRNRRLKVDVLARAISKMELGTIVETHPTSLFDPSAIKAVANCDIVFGCMDSIDGRHLLNKLATFYLLPYFDLGVKIEADGRGGVDQVCGTVHYLQPGGSSLLSRNVYTMEQVRAAGIYRTDPAAYRSQLDQGYIRGVPEDRPAVIQLNSLVASVAINELLARLHPYRIDPQWRLCRAPDQPQPRHLRTRPRRATMFIVCPAHRPRRYGPAARMGRAQCPMQSAMSIVKRAWWSFIDLLRPRDAYPPKPPGTFPTALTPGAYT